MAGGGPEEMSLRELARTLGCEREITFTGSIPREQIPALLSTADVFVFPSLRREGMPMNVLEALATGLPCVCSDTMTEVFSTTLPIFYAPPLDAPKFAATVARAYSAEGLRGSRLPIGYSLRECAEAYIELINQLARARSRG